MSPFPFHYRTYSSPGSNHQHPLPAVLLPSSDVLTRDTSVLHTRGGAERITRSLHLCSSLSHINLLVVNDSHSLSNSNTSLWLYAADMRASGQESLSTHTGHVRYGLTYVYTCAHTEARPPAVLSYRCTPQHTVCPPFMCTSPSSQAAWTGWGQMPASLGTVPTDHGPAPPCSPPPTASTQKNGSDLPSSPTRMLEPPGPHCDGSSGQDLPPEQTTSSPCPTGPSTDGAG